MATLVLTVLRSCRLSASIISTQCHTALKCSQYQFSTNVTAVPATNKKDELYRRLTLEVKGHHAEILKSYQQFTQMAAKELGVNIVNIYEPPITHTRMSLMKSVFVHKKHFHQYEMRTYYKIFQIKHITGSTANTFLEYIQRNLPEGVAMKVTRLQIEPFPSHIHPPSDSNNRIEDAQSSQKSSTN